MRDSIILRWRVIDLDNNSPLSPFIFCLKYTEISFQPSSIGKKASGVGGPLMLCVGLPVALKTPHFSWGKPFPTAPPQGKRSYIQSS